MLRFNITKEGLILSRRSTESKRFLPSPGLIIFIVWGTQTFEIGHHRLFYHSFLEEKNGKSSSTQLNWQCMLECCSPLPLL